MFCVIILRFYKIHLFLFDRNTFKCCEVTRNGSVARELCHDSTEQCGDDELACYKIEQ